MSELVDVAKGARAPDDEAQVTHRKSIAGLRRTSDFELGELLIYVSDTEFRCLKGQGSPYPWWFQRLRSCAVNAVLPKPSPGARAL